MRGISTICVYALCVLPWTVHAETLQQAVEHTMKTNPDIHIKAKAASAARAALDGSYSGYLPKLDVNAGIGHEGSYNNTTIGRTGGWDDMTRQELGATLTQNVFEGFHTYNEVERNKARTRSFAIEVEAESNDIAFRVAETYINVVRRTRLKHAALKNVRKLKSIVDMIQLRTQKGISRRSDLVQALGRLAFARSIYRIAQGDHQRAEAEYFRVVGLPARGIKKPKFPNRLMPKSEKEAITQAIHYHPVIRHSVADVDEAKSQHESAKAPFFPRLDVVLAANRNREVDGVRGPNYDMMAMGRATWNLFNGGADIARKRETAFLVQESKQVRNRAYRQTVESVQVSWVSYITARRTMKLARDHMRASRSTADSYRKQFKLGQRTLLDLLDAENEYYNARRTYIGVMIDCLLSKYRVANSSGRMLEVVRAEAPPEANITPRTYADPVPHALEEAWPGHDFSKKYPRTRDLPPAEQVHDKGVPLDEPKKTEHPKETADYTMQILAASDRAKVEAYAKAHNLQDKSQIVVKQVNGKDWYVLVYGGYANKAAAEKAKLQVAKKAGGLTPKIYSYNDLQKQLKPGTQIARLKIPALRKPGSKAGVKAKAGAKVKVKATMLAKKAKKPAAPKPIYTVEVKMGNSVDELKKYTSKYKLQKTKVIHRNISGRMQYVLTQGEYNTLTEAQAASKKLQRTVPSSQPLVRHLSVVTKEMVFSKPTVPNQTIFKVAHKDVNIHFQDVDGNEYRDLME